MGARGSTSEDLPRRGTMRSGWVGRLTDPETIASPTITKTVKTIADFIISPNPRRLIQLVFGQAQGHLPAWLSGGDVLRGVDGRHRGETYRRTRRFIVKIGVSGYCQK